MSRRRKILLILLAVLAAIFWLHPCRPADPPDHPVPVSTPYEPNNTPIANPAAK